MRIKKFQLRESKLKNTIVGSLTNILNHGNGASLCHMANYTKELSPRLLKEKIEQFGDWALQNDLVVLVYSNNAYVQINGDDVDFVLMVREGESLKYALNDAPYKRVHSYANSLHIGELLESDHYGVFTSLIGDLADSYSTYSDFMDESFYAVAIDIQNCMFYTPEGLGYTGDNFVFIEHSLTLPETEDLAKKWLTIAGGDVECSPVETKAVETNNPINKTEKVEIMSKVNAVVNVNKTALVTAAKLEAGKIGLKQMSKLVQPAIPMMLRGYADTAMGRVALANIFHFAASNYAGGNDKVKVVADAMLEAAMVEFVGSFNIEEIFEKVIGGIDISKLTSNDE